MNHSGLSVNAILNCNLRRRITLPIYYESKNPIPSSRRFVWRPVISAPCS